MRTLLRNCSYSVALVHILLPASCHLKASLWALFSSSSLNNSPETKLSGSPSVSMYVLCFFSFLFVSTLSSLSNTSPSPLRTSITPVLPSLSTHTWSLRDRGQPLGAGSGARLPAQKSPSQVWRGGITNLPTAIEQLFLRPCSMEIATQTTYWIDRTMEGVEVSSMQTGEMRD